MSDKKKQSRVSPAKRFAQIEQISVFGLTARMGPVGLHTYANAFLDAARTLPPATVPFEPVRPFLVCHSIELSLKAYLSLQGTTMLQLADGAYGHNLEEILKKADEKSLALSVSLTEAQRTVIRQASVYYVGKVFEYPAIGEALSAYPRMPALDVLFEIATILATSLRQKCLEAE